MLHITVASIYNSLSQNCWDTLLSSYPSNVGAEDLVSQLWQTTLKGQLDGPDIKQKNIVGSGSVPTSFVWDCSCVKHTE